MVPEPWYMRSRPSPEDLVRQIAASLGQLVSVYAARAIADALLGYADTSVGMRQQVTARDWAHSETRERVRHGMRMRLLDEVARQGLIPAALPSEAIRYLRWPMSIGDDARQGEVPAWAVEQGEPYDLVEVTLAVQVRTPREGR